MMQSIKLLEKQNLVIAKRNSHTKDIVKMHTTALLKCQMMQNFFGKSVDVEVHIILEFWCCYLHFSCDKSKQNMLL